MNNNNKRQRLDGMNCDDVPENWAHQEKRELFFIKTAMLILTRMNLKEYFCSFRAKEQKIPQSNQSFPFLLHCVLFTAKVLCMISTHEWYLCLCVLSQSCPTFFKPMDCSPPDSSVHGIFQARLLEQVTISFSRGSSRPKDWTWVSCIGRFYTTEPPGKH